MKQALVEDEPFAIINLFLMGGLIEQAMRVVPKPHTLVGTVSCRRRERMMLGPA